MINITIIFSTNKYYIIIKQMKQIIDFFKTKNIYLTRALMGLNVLFSYLFKIE